MYNNSKSVTFVYGGDDFLVDRRARVVFETLSSGSGEIFNLNNDGSLISDIKNITSAIDTVSLFDSSNSIWLRDVLFLADSSFSEEKNEAIKILIQTLKAPHEKKILISAGKVDKRTKFFKEIVSISNVIELDHEIKPEKIASVIKNFAHENKINMADEAIELLQIRCGVNCRCLEQEIKKISSYIWGRSNTATKRDVLDIVDEYNEGNFFDSVECFFSKNLTNTLTALDKYFFYESDARPLIAALQSRNRILLQLQCLLGSQRIKLSHNNIVKDDFLNVAKIFYMDCLRKSSFNIFSQNVWYLSKLIMSCAKFEISDLMKFQILFTRTFREIIARPNDQQAIMQQLAINCLELT